MDHYDDLLRTQITLEEEARTASINRVQRQLDLAVGRSEGENSSQGRMIVAATIDKVIEAIDSQISAVEAQGRGRRASTITALAKCSLDVEEIAFIAFRSVVHTAMGSFRGTGTKRGKVTWASLSKSIANRLVDEMVLRDVAENDRGLVAKWTAELSERGLTRPRAVEMIHKQASGMDLDWTYTDPEGLEWNLDVRAKIGRVLAEIILRTTGLMVAKKRYQEGSRKKRDEVLEPTEEFMELVERAGEFLAESVPIYYPTVIPPVEWSTDYMVRGGYYTQNVKPYPIIKKSTKAWRDEFQPTSGNTVAALNAIQATAWRVHPEILEAVEFVYERGNGDAGLPLKDRLALPEAPEEFSIEYRRKAYQIHETNRSQLGKRLQFLTALDLAKKFSAYGAIYFPHDCDSRGRIYPKPTTLNPQGPAYVKALLEFADGKPLGTTEAAAWLAIHVANTYGMDKLKLEERIEWTQDNSVMIQEVARNWRCDDRWLEADSPFEFLAAAISWLGYETEGLDYHCRTPIAVDATCSGLQHYSAMLRDGVGGRSVNLTAEEERQDVYQEVADRATDLLRDKDWGDKRDLAAAVLKFGIKRSTVKRQVMTVPYAATFSSCMSYTRDSIKERIAGGEDLAWDGDFTEVVKFTAAVIWESISDVVVAATEAMQWIKRGASKYAREADAEYLEWMSPSGFVARIAKHDIKECMVDTILDGRRLRMRYVKEGPQLDARSMSTSTPPSFVHSLDAAHLVLTMEEARRRGCTHLGVVHDSFSAHAADMELLGDVIRWKFHEMYTECCPLSMLKEALEEGCKEPLPALPTMGDLDIDEVLQSTFIFS